MLSLIHSCPSRNTFHNMVWYYCMCYAMVFSLVFSVQFQTYIRNTLHPVLCWATGCMWSLLVCTTLLSQLLLVVSPVVSLFQHFQFLLLGTAPLLAYYCCWYHTHLLAFLQQLCIWFYSPFSAANTSTVNKLTASEYFFITMFHFNFCVCVSVLASIGFQQSTLSLAKSSLLMLVNLDCW